jgi:hypothetical protein
MREQMPTAAWLVDHLREWVGTEAANALLLRSKRGQVSRGQGGFYMAEVGPDGVLREFGTSVDGWRGQVVDGTLVRVNKKGLPCS